MLIRDLVDAILDDTESVAPLQLRTGVAISFQGVLTTVQLGGSTVNIAGVRSLKSAVFVAGETILLLKQGPSLIILGAVGT